MSFYQFGCYMNSIKDIDDMFAGKGMPKSRNDTPKDVATAMQAAGVIAPR